MNFKPQQPSFLPLLGPGLLMLLLLGAALPSWAGNWHIIPIRVEFDSRTRSGVISITNEAENRLTLNVEGLEWTQTEEGEDVYLPTDNLIYFPKVLRIGPLETRVIRVGMKTPTVGMEKTYRLFIKEVPDSKSAASNTVNIAIQFGVPIFASPPVVTAEGRITPPAYRGGELGFEVRNTGNVHFRIKNVELFGRGARGEDLFSESFEGWYVLGAGRQRFGTEVPSEVCRQLQSVDIKVDTGKLRIQEEFPFDPSVCL